MLLAFGQIGWLHTNIIEEIKSTKLTFRQKGRAFSS